MSKSINELNSDLFGSEADERFSSPLEARKKAMDFLARREYGHNELISKLESRGYLPDVATEAVDRLAGQGLQNDERFVENFLQSRVKQGKGPLRIGQELSQRGLKAGLVDQVLGAADTDWFELASDVRTRKFGDQVPGEFEEKARQMRFLQYRGFNSEQIRFAVAGNRS
jgi:regulatory protein